MLELKGNAAIKGLLNAYKPILVLSNKEFNLLLHEEKNDTPIASRLFHRLSNKHIGAYIHAMDTLKENEIKGFKYRILEWYFRARLLIDFISGMTDEFAITEYKILSAIK